VIRRRFEGEADKEKAPIPADGALSISFSLLHTDQPMPMKDRTARTITTAPTSHTMLFMTVSFSVRSGWKHGFRLDSFNKSSKPDEIQNGDDDDDCADQPNDAVHDVLLLMS